MKIAETVFHTYDAVDKVVRDIYRLPHIVHAYRATDDVPDAISPRIKRGI